MDDYLIKRKYFIDLYDNKLDERVFEGATILSCLR